jgi:predicted O-methyltransferase YrrM
MSFHNHEGRVTLRAALRRIKEFFRYHCAFILGKPYYGRRFLAQQAWANRMPAMAGLLRREIHSQGNALMNVLEVGSWAGSSATLWARILQEENNPGRVFCIDLWGAYKSLPPAMRAAIKHDRIFKLFIHNVRTCGLLDKVSILRGTSDDFGELLKPQSFWFVYLDGDHAYSQFRRDLDHYMPLVKIGGVICGDDLDLPVAKVDLQNAIRHKEEDLTEDPQERVFFHPGVSVALREVFGDVSMNEGFWAMRRRAAGWEKVAL